MNAVAPMGELSADESPWRKGQKFPRGMRLLRHADFERVYKQGRRHFSTSMTVFYLRRSGEGEASDEKAHPYEGPRIGFTVGRTLGRAVQRNRMKRRLREAVRLNPLPQALPVDVVINPKKLLLDTDFQNIVNEIGRAFVIMEQKLGGSPAPQSRRPESGSQA